MKRKNFTFKNAGKLGMMAHTHNLSTGAAGAELP